jgi:hypothetical protein
MLSKTSSSKLLNPLIGLKFFDTSALRRSACSQCSVQMQKALAAFAAGLPGKSFQLTLCPRRPSRRAKNSQRTTLYLYHFHRDNVNFGLQVNRPVSHKRFHQGRRISGQYRKYYDS